MSVSECSNSKQDEGPPKWRSTRFSLAYMIFTGLIVMFYQRSSFSMVIVCMVNHTALDTQRRTAHLAEMNSSVDNDGANISAVGLFPYAVSNKTMTSDAGTDGRCHREDSTTSSDEDGPFLWDKDLQGLLLGALYWGYTVVQIPGSYVIQRYGARMVVGVAMVCMSVFHILCHPGALLSPWAVFALRVAVGLCTGVAIPAMYSVWGRWAPLKERAQLLAVSFTGQMIANASAFPISALLCRHGFWDGWPSVFYVFGVIGLLWSTFWLFLMSNSPESHSRISPAEKAYIVSTRGDATAQKQKLKVPWKSIVTAPCFWAIAVSQFTYNWAFFFMLSNLPIFLKEAMDLDIKSNGVFSMLPYLFMFVVMMSAGFVSDAIISRRLLTVATSRKLFTVIAYLVSAVSLVVMSHQECSEVAAVVSLLVLAVGIMGMANTGGFYVNPYDIAPRFATSICTATNTMATVTGIINPYIVAIITKDKTRSQWQDVYYITAGIFAFGTLFFCIFGQGEVQEWARLPDEEFETKSELTTFKRDDKEHGDDHQKKIYIVSSQRL